jgi:hypothetical protein
VLRSPSSPTGEDQSLSQGAVPAAFAVVLLVLTTTSQGGFAISRWATLALFALAVVTGSLARASRVARPRAATLALGGLWGLAGLGLLSMAWADSSANALLAGDELLLYAAIAALPFVLPLGPRALAATGWATAAGIGAIALLTLGRLLVDGQPLFLAGRLNGPVNYRNATALLFALPVWPFIAATGARAYNHIARATAFALAVLCLALVFLTQSRGILIGLVLGALVAIGLGPDRVRRAWLALLATGIVAAATHWLLRPYDAFDAGSGVVTGHAIAVAGRGALAATVVAFVVGFAIALFDNGLRAGSPQMRHVRSTARAVLLAGVLVGVIGAAIAIGNPVSFAHRKWDQFKQLNASTTNGIRYGSVSGQRYDLWRVAVKEWEQNPVLGVGAQNYSFGYYRDRRSNRNLNDPHSLVFGILAEEGTVGILLFGLFVGGFAALIVTGWRRMGPAERRHAVGPIAAGAVLLGQSSVDWIWLIPGVTALGLFALSVGAAQVAAHSAPSAPVSARASSHVRRGARVAAALGLTVAMLSVLSVLLSDAYVQRARALTGDPPAELSAARTASALEPWSLTPHYLQASALETLGDRPAAYAQLLDALRLEPLNVATLGVLGDFEARGRDFARARSYYRRALALDPLDTGLQRLSKLGLPGGAPS